MRTAIILVDLGFGDCGKGATTDALVRRTGAELVVRYNGGCQAGHGVQLPDGRRHTFSQFGAGTLAGARTYLGPGFIFCPAKFRREAAGLARLGIPAAQELVTIHPDTLVTTFYHGKLNQIRELARGSDRHGSCGYGIGETRKYAIEHPGDAIYITDLNNPRQLQRKLAGLREYFLGEISALLGTGAALRPDVIGACDMLPSELIRMELHGGDISISETLPHCDTAIFEGAQGVLLDQWNGFHPNTTWSDTTAVPALDIVSCVPELEYSCVLGITRTFLTRHGAGPLPTYERALTDSLRDPGNPANAWQGSMRAGYFDCMLFNYATRAVGCPIDGYVVTWCDKRPTLICTEYDNVGAGDDFSPPRLPDLARQERLGALLATARPVLTRTGSGTLFEQIGIDGAVLMTGSGPAHTDYAVKREVTSRLHRIPVLDSMIRATSTAVAA
jgi:adenylosuccinate synthase